MRISDWSSDVCSSDRGARPADAGRCAMISIASPLAGWVTPLDEVPDPVFADRMLGDGVAIDPTDGRLVAPGDGPLESVHPAGHAVTIAPDAGRSEERPLGQGCVR